MEGRVPALLLAGVVTFVASIPCWAVDPTPSAEEIVARHVSARGGAESLARINSLIYRGEYHEGDYRGPAAMALMRPFFKLVGDPEQLSMEFREGYDGSAWEFYSDPGIVVRTAGPASAAARHGLAIEGRLAGYRGDGSTLTLLGNEAIAGRKAYRVRVHMRDGFEEDEFVDAESWMWVASRKAAPIHAFGAAVSTESRFSDFRRVAGVLFAFSDRETEIATGRVLNEMQWTSIDANVAIPEAAFSPPVLPLTPLQRLLDQLYSERTDAFAVLWSYADFRKAFPAVDSDAGIQAIGYQMLKMGQSAGAVALLQANAADHPRSSGAASAWAAPTARRDGARRAAPRSLARWSSTRPTRAPRASSCAARLRRDWRTHRIETPVEIAARDPRHELMDRVLARRERAGHVAS